MLEATALPTEPQPLPQYRQERKINEKEAEDGPELEDDSLLLQTHF